MAKKRTGSRRRGGGATGTAPPAKTPTRNRPRTLGRDAPRRWLVAGVLLLAVAIVYGNTLPNGFVFDDYDLVVDNHAIRSLDRIPAILGLDDGTPHYRPVRFVSYAVDHALFGLDPRGFHLSNVVHHAACVWLVFLVTRRLAASAGVALIAALLFAVHPVHTDAVTYVSGRRDLLSTLFYLAGFLAFLRYRAGGGPANVAVLVIAYGLAVFSKEMAVTLPLAMFAYDAYAAFPASGGPLARWIGTTLVAVARRHRWLYGPAFGLALLFVLYKVVLHNPSQMEGLYGENPWLHTLTMARVVVTYLGLLCFPRTLIADYSYDTFPVTTSAADPAGIGALLLLAVILAGLVLAAPRARLVTFGGLWFFICLLPVMQIVPHHELMAEHYLYLPSVGIFWIAALAAEAGRKRFGRYALVGTAAVLVALGMRTVTRNLDWRDDLTLWRRTVESAPRNARARDNLGTAHARAGELDLAIREFEAAVRINPRHVQAYHHLGDALYWQGRLEPAEAAYRRALRLAPDLPRVRFSLGRVLVRRGAIEPAIRAYEAAVRLEPRYADAHQELATAYYFAGRLDAARRHYRRALAIRPGRNVARRYLGIVETERGDREAAVAAFRGVLARDPRDVESHVRLAGLLGRGRPAEALEHLRTALRIAPDHPRAPEIRALIEGLRVESRPEP